jgi:hypothetical protein
MQENSLPPPKRKKTAKKTFSPEVIARRQQYAANKALRDAKKKEEVARQRRMKAKKKVDAIKEFDKVLDNEDNKIIAKESFDQVDDRLTSAENVNIIFKPNEGPQTDFLESGEQQVLYGGAAGGGKSYALLADAMRDAWHSQYRGIIFRRTNDELRELIDKSKQLYPLVYPGAQWLSQQSTWRFPSGANLWLTYLERDDDVMRYQGQAFTYIGFDELTQWPTPYCWNYLSSRLRTTASDLNLVQRATTNPGGPGAAWVRRMFIDPAPPGKAFWATDIDTDDNRVLVAPPGHVRAGQPLYKRRFIPAKLSDNPYLMQDGRYETSLLALPEAQRRRLLDGDWDVAEGAAFPEFRRYAHVVDPFPIPPGWMKFRACDYGYRQPCCILWMATDFDNNVYVYREYYRTMEDVSKITDTILDIERNDRVRYGVLDRSVWSRRGETGPSPAEYMQRAGINWRPSDSSPGSRISGAQEVHRRLHISDPIIIPDPQDPEKEIVIPGKPRLFIFSNCVNLIRTLPIIPMDKSNPEDVDTEAEDHAYDALRYGLMSRPLSPGTRAVWDNSRPTRVARPTPLDNVFGY